MREPCSIDIHCAAGECCNSDGKCQSKDCYVHVGLADWIIATIVIGIVVFFVIAIVLAAFFVLRCSAHRGIIETQPRPATQNTTQQGQPICLQNLQPDSDPPPPYQPPGTAYQQPHQQLPRTAYPPPYQPPGTGYLPGAPVHTDVIAAQPSTTGTTTVLPPQQQQQLYPLQEGQPMYPQNLQQYSDPPPPYTTPETAYPPPYINLQEQCTHQEQVVPSNSNDTAI